MAAQFDTEWMEAWQQAAAADSTLGVIGRKCTVRFLLEIGDRSYLVDLDGGRIERMTNLADVGIDAWWTFAIRGPEESWARYVQQVPPPLYTDLVFMSFHSNVVIEGDTLVFWQHCRALLWLFDLMRKADAGAAVVA
jgi:hypothetical protein